MFCEWTSEARGASPRHYKILANIYALCQSNVRLKYIFCLFRIFNCFFFVHLLFYKQLGSGLRPQSCLYFKGFWGSKLFNGCFGIWQKNLRLLGMQQFSRFKIDIYDQWFKNFANEAFGTAELWTLITKKKVHFSLICSFYRYIVKKAELWKLLSNLLSKG